MKLLEIKPLGFYRTNMNNKTEGNNNQNTIRSRETESLGAT